MINFLAVTVLPLGFLSVVLGYAAYRSWRRGDWLLASGSLVLVFMLVHQAFEFREFLLFGTSQDSFREIPETLVNILGSLVILLLANSRFNLEKIKNRLQRTNEELETALERKKTLLREIHHRVKNNLQMVVSLLNLESNRLESAEGSRRLEEIAARVRSMAILHERLYSPSSVDQLDTSRYFRELLEESLRTSSFDPSDIQSDINVDVESLDLDVALCCGLLVNELVSNAVEHGLEGGQGRIGVSLKTDNGQYELKVRDSGGNYTLGAIDDDSMGLELVRTIATDHLNGTVEVSGGEATVFTVRFPRGS